MYGSVVNPRFQSFRNVCDGGHIWNLDDLTPEKLKKGLRQNDKAVLVVGISQLTAIKTLRNRPALKKLGLRSKLVGAWSGTADLWYVFKA
jgi:hypothetical protein